MIPKYKNVQIGSLEEEAKQFAKMENLKNFKFVTNNMKAEPGNNQEDDDTTDYSWESRKVRERSPSEDKVSPTSVGESIYDFDERPAKRPKLESKTPPKEEKMTPETGSKTIKKERKCPRDDSSSESSESSDNEDDDEKKVEKVKAALLDNSDEKDWSDPHVCARFFKSILDTNIRISYETQRALKRLNEKHEAKKRKLALTKKVVGAIKKPETSSSAIKFTKKPSPNAAKRLKMEPESPVGKVKGEHLLDKRDAKDDPFHNYLNDYERKVLNDDSNEANEDKGEPMKPAADILYIDNNESFPDDTRDPNGKYSIVLSDSLIFVVSSGQGGPGQKLLELGASTYFTYYFSGRLQDCKVFQYVKMPVISYQNFSFTIFSRDYWRVDSVSPTETDWGRQHSTNYHDPLTKFY